MQCNQTDFCLTSRSREEFVFIPVCSVNGKVWRNQVRQHLWFQLRICDSLSKATLRSPLKQKYFSKRNTSIMGKIRNVNPKNQRIQSQSGFCKKSVIVWRRMFTTITALHSRRWSYFADNYLCTWDILACTKIAFKALIFSPDAHWLTDAKEVN